ncbi:hypothetical protein ICN11_01520 [Polynucleobacter sp. 78F-HAINBA]|uniref:hypothetical protein n=1 Tax=Polynucleobacter sp. 78F-HAINBA TaxID=2689099 RepID=UPI001C0E4364|nr:hypothetical protein [Polynucleobacter sp. 78F-HAINBA]MBU3590699.1 hypothetical protein [Polynucleobacter sp. 78F-HAINBA]
MTLSKLGWHLTVVTFTFAVGSILMGCSLYPDVNTDPAKNNKATFRQDALDCAQSYPESGSGIHVKQRIACMNLKGWH